MRTATIRFLVIWLIPCLPVCRADFDEAVDSPMYAVPELTAPRVDMVFPEAAKGLWLRALEGPDTDLRYKAADAIALAHRRGVKGFETAVAPLLAALDRPDQHPTVRLAAAKALIALDAKDAAPSLFRHARSGDSDLRDLVEPALARWDDPSARALWLERLRDPATPPRNLVLAIRGLATVREAQAVDRLRDLVLAERGPVAIRLEAARALSVLKADGLEKDAERLAADASPRGTVARLAAASLLQRHASAEAVRVLQRLTRAPEPAAVALAVARLTDLDPKLVVPDLERLLASPDAKLRALAVEVLFRVPTEKHLPLLADRLDDLHPDVRREARQRLHDLTANKEIRTPIIAEAVRVLAAESWRGQEQAAILLARLDHKPAAGRLAELLASGRPEVCVTAAWGLRRLAVPESLPGVVSYVGGAMGKRSDVTGEILDHQFSQLNQLLGERKYGPGDALLRRFVPRSGGRGAAASVGPESRAAAIWALGLLHEDKAVPALAAAFEARLNDIGSMPPEDNRVRRMSAVALGRLKAKEAVPSLRAFCPDQKPSTDSVATACGWAVARITGEALLPPETIRIVRRDWFLVPNE